MKTIDADWLIHWSMNNPTEAFVIAEHNGRMLIYDPSAPIDEGVIAVTEMPDGSVVTLHDEHPEMLVRHCDVAGTA